jgi:hypothetical protein
LFAANSVGVEEVGKNEFVLFPGLGKPLVKRFDPLD